MRNFTERLNYIIETKYRDKWTKLAKECEISVGSFERYVKGKGKPGFDQIVRICEVTAVNPTWLLTGEGPMWKDDKETEAKIGEDHNARKSGEDKNMVYIPYFENTLAGAGNGAVNYEDAPRIMAFQPHFLQLQLGIHNFRNLHIINVIGDSMEPTLKSGELIFVNPIENEGGQVISGGIYVLLYDGDVLVKRVEKNPVTKSLTLISDNKTYEPIKIEGDNLERLKIIGRVVGHFDRV